MCHPCWYPVVSETSPPLGPIHTQPHMGVCRQQPSLMPFWFALLAFSWWSSVCAYVCVFASVGQQGKGTEVTRVVVQMSAQLAEPHEWQLLWWWRGNALEAWPTHSSHLNGRNSTWSKDKLMRADWKQCALFITFFSMSLCYCHSIFNHSFYVAASFIVPVLSVAHIKYILIDNITDAFLIIL